MLWRLNHFVAVAATALAFAYCGWFIAGDTGAAVSALLSLAMFLKPANASRQNKQRIATSPPGMRSPRSVPDYSDRA